MQYVEMIAHQCKTVLAPGVAWPEYVATEKRGNRSFDRRKPYKVKEQILDLLKHGAALTASKIKEEIGGPLATVQTNLCLMRARGEVMTTKRKMQAGKPVNIYSMAATCILH